MACFSGSEERSRSSLHKLPRLQMWTKLRPFAHEFLEEASKMYEMCVYTMGERIYASTVVQLLDPTGRLFGDRVISQLDSTRRNTKDLDVVLGAESAVVILDDTEGVWPNHRANLILMERYHFFTSSTRQFGMKSPSLANAHRDESESEGTLAMTLNTLRHVHRGFFHSNATQGGKRKPRSFDTRDVRQVIRDLRAEILTGCKIVFSRIFPTGLPSPQLHPFWQLTEELGAKCSSVCDVSTTHVVALDRGTDKAQWAKQHGVFLVHPSWVEAAQYLWRRPLEADYPVTDDNSGCPVATFAKSVVVEPRTMPTQESNEDEQPGPTYADSQDNVIETTVLDSSHLVVTNGLEKVNAEHNGTTGTGKEDLIICS
jgi:RNA polymerase II C-terminal domain phosphatase-like 3/4